MAARSVNEVGKITPPLPCHLKSQPKSSRFCKGGNEALLRFSLNALAFLFIRVGQMPTSCAVISCKTNSFIPVLTYRHIQPLELTRAAKFCAAASTREPG